MIMHYIEDAGDVVPCRAMDGATVVEVSGISMATTPRADRTSGEHRRVIRQRARLLAIRACVEGIGPLTHQPVKCRGTGLSELGDSSGVEAIDGDGDHMIDRVVGIIRSLILRGTRKYRRLCRRRRDRGR